MSVMRAEGQWSSPVRPDQIDTPPTFIPEPKYTDRAVLGIVVQDWQRASAWLADRLWVMYWREADTLFQSPRTQAVYENSSVSRSNVSRFDVAKTVNSLAPAIAGAIFSEPTPFDILPRPSVHAETSRAWKALIDILLRLCNFKQELTYGIEGMCNQGTVIFKIGWEEYTDLEIRWERKASPTQVDMPLGGNPVLVFTRESEEFEKVEKEVVRKRPIFEKCELGQVFPDPKWNSPNNIGEAAWVVHEFYLNYEDLKRLKQDPNYDVPDDDTLRFIFTEPAEEQTEETNYVAATLHSNPMVHHAAREDQDYSEDPLQRPMQVLEWWSGTEVRTVLQQKVVIRNERHNLKRIPFLSANFWNVEDGGWGIGVGRVTGSDQRVNQGITNAALDIIAYACQPEYVVARGANVPAQELRRRLGGIRLVDGMDATKAVTMVPQPSVPADAWRILQDSRMTADNATGADQAALQGSLPPRGSSIARSGTGAGMIQAAAQGRLQAVIERVIEGVFLPFLRFLWEIAPQHLSTAEIRGLLGQWSEPLLVDFYNFLNADIEFDSVAGSRLAARAQMSQSLPFLLEIFGNQTLIQQMQDLGWKVDVLEVANMVMEVSGWRNRKDLIVPMTPEEKQQAQMNNPQVLQQQAQQQAQQSQAETQAQLEDQKIKGRIVVNAMKQQGSKIVESPLDRATAFTQRLADQNELRASQFFGAPYVPASSQGGGFAGGL